MVTESDTLKRTETNTIKKHMRRTHNIILRVSQQERDTMFSNAKDKGLTVSEYIRLTSTSTLE